MEYDWEKLLSLDNLNEKPQKQKNRTRAQRDYDSITFTSCFRRLGGKTQVFPHRDSEQIHSRLTHTLEVISISRSFGYLLTEKLCSEQGITGEWKRLQDAIKDKDKEGGDIVARVYKVDFPAMLSAAAMLHDLGNPPFGHSGEQSISKWFEKKFFKKNKDGNLKYCDETHKNLTEQEANDLRYFDGNAQSIRIAITATTYNGINMGLGLDKNIIGICSKYPWPPSEGEKNQKKGKGCFFLARKGDIENYWEELGLSLERKERHPFSWLVEASDDLINPLIDLEDGMEQGLIKLGDARKIILDIYEKCGIKPDEVSSDHLSDVYQIQGLTRPLIPYLISFAWKKFDSWFNCEVTSSKPWQNGIFDKLYEELKGNLKSKVYQSKEIISLEYSGRMAIESILDHFCTPLIDNNTLEDESLFKLMPSSLYNQLIKPSCDLYQQLRIIIDFVSSMTDEYAIKFNNELNAVTLR
jgi:dGTPase